MEDLEQGLFNKEFLDIWHSNYRKLAAFCKQHKASAAEPDEELIRWAGIQENIKYLLPAELKNQLAALDFHFKARSGSWDAMYRKLSGFVQQNGHAYLPDDSKHEVLKDWLTRQILNKRLLSKIQLQHLNSLGIDWDMAISRDHRWELMHMRLKDFQEAFGHCRVPQRWAKDKQLALWVTVQRRMHAKGKMREDRHRLLQDIGFVWDMKTQYDAQWEKYFQELVSFYKLHGHCRVPGNYQKLVSWIERQRIAKTKNLLPAEREKQLRQINFIWSFDNIKKENWEERYRQLRAYRQTHGHSFVPVNCTENKSLGIWVASQRWLEAKGKLGAARKKKLNDLGFVWSKDTQKELQSIYDTQWENNLEKLKDYRQTHGSCQVSLKIDPVLQRWTRWQRKLFYEGRLSAERIDRLNEIRFPWSVQEGYWMKMYDALADYKKQFGHTRVPCQWELNPRLAAWAYRTRRDKKALTPQKIELLNSIGFDWAHSRRKVVPWGEMYSRLRAFKQQHGHTRVPLKWREDPKLAKWVSRMRHQKAGLTQERLCLLEAIAFDWSGRAPYRKPAGNHKNNTYDFAQVS